MDSGGIVKGENHMKSGGRMNTWILVFLAIFVLAGGSCQKKSQESETVQALANKPLPHGAFKAKISIENPPPSLAVNSISTIKLKVMNISDSPWPSKVQSDVKYPIYLSYHWLDKNGMVQVRDGYRNSLLRNLNRNEEIRVDATVFAPSQPGEYILEFDLVQEFVAWFKDQGSETASVNIRID
jgi:uncharacterized protein YcfL